MSLANALKWSFLSELAAKAVQPIVFIVLARLLTPEDFGVMSAALLVLAFSQIFWEAGMGAALIQRRTDIEDAANAAFVVNIALGLGIATLIIISAERVAEVVFHDGRVAAVLQCMALQVLLGSVSSVHTALLQRNMGFKKLFWVRFATVGLAGIVSIALAWSGMSYWALVVGTLVGQTGQVGMLWRMSHWRPAWHFNMQVAREMLQFGAWLVIEGLLGWFYIWADSLMVGSALGIATLGVYHTGNTFVLLAFAVLMAPLQPVLFSAFSRMQDQTLIAKSLLKVQRIQFMLALPIGIGLFLLQSEIKNIVFHNSWPGIEKVIGILGLMHGASWLMGSNAQAFKAIGRPDVFTKIMAIGLCYYIPIYAYSLTLGMEVFLWVRLLLFAVSQPLHFIALSKVLGIQPKEVFANASRVIFAAIVSVGAYLMAKYWLTNSNSADLTQLSLYIVVTAPITFLMLWTEWHALTRGQK